MKPNPSILAVALLLLSIVAYVGLVSPMSDSLFKARTALSDEELRLSGVELAIAQRTDMQSRTAALEKENAGIRTAWITPMLSSYGMRAKSLLDALATEAGLTNVEYAEGPFFALPVPQGQMPTLRTARQSVRVKAAADYAAIVSFLMRAEKTLPLMALQALAIRPTQAPERQEMDMVLEWPCEGRVVK